MMARYVAFPDGSVAVPGAVNRRHFLDLADREVFYRLQAAVAAISEYAPHGIADPSVIDMGRAVQIFDEELTACAEALQKWRAQCMRREVKAS